MRSAPPLRTHAHLHLPTDWYNSEHVPLRMEHLPSFLTGARFSASDAQCPSWVAVYDVDDPETFQHESYTRLRANRSPREAALVRRLEILDRRTCVLLRDSGASPLTSSFGARDPTRVILTHSVRPRGSTEAAIDTDAVRAWVEDIEVTLRGIEGWVRTRTFRCIDSLRSGQGVPPGPEAQEVPPYLVVHGESRHSAMLDSSHMQLLELLTPSAGDALAQVILQEDSRITISEVRRWELYRAYPSLAQKL